MTTARFLAAAGALALVGLLLAPPPAVGSSHGAGPGFAGDQADVGEVRTCATCHSSFELGSGSGSVTVDAPAGATVGEPVTVTVTVDNQTDPAPGAARRQGFQATVRDVGTGDRAGTLALLDAASTRFSSSGETYVTHTTGGTSQTSWSFEWTPDADGVARVYVAVNAADGDGTSAGDRIYAATADVLVGPVVSEPAPAAAFSVGDPSPHPVRAGRTARLAVGLEAPGSVTVRLVDGAGRVVREVLRGDRPAGPLEVTVGTGGLATGLYFVVVEGPGGRASRPLVVAR